MAEIDYGSVFGVETSGGGNESAPAEQTTPAAETQEDTAGENEAEVADQPGADKQQSPEENAKFAAARRKAEQERDAAIAQARQQAQRSLDEAIAAMGQTNPYTGRPIQTKAEWDAWKAQERTREVAESAGMSEQEFGNFVNNLPQVRAANAAAAAARQQQQKLILDEQISAINKLDPGIKTVADLMERPEYKQIYANVQKGLSIVDAYKLVNFDSLTQSKAAGARQAALNSAAGKEHMAPTQSRGAGAVTVPKDVKEMYRLYNPEATDAEIQAHYAKFHKQNE